MGEGSENLEGRRDQYDPTSYWSQRLSRNSNLRGVGHLQYSEGYNQWIYRQKARVLDQVLPPAHAAGNALDVGSGIGWVVNHLVSRGWTSTGCDISEVAVEVLRSRFPTSTFFRHAFGAEQLAAGDAEFDLVTMLDVTYHVVDDRLWRAGLDELARVVKPGGHLVLLDRFGGSDDDVAAHVRFRSLSTWDSNLTALGLRRDRLVPAYRWLSRPTSEGSLRSLPDSVRGPVEYALERVAPRAPHMRCARYVKAAPST